jgi:hypothetical protein
MASEDALAQGQKLFVEALSNCTEREARTELGLLFNDLISATRGSELEAPLRAGYSGLHHQMQRERERDTGPNLEQALKAVVG